MGDPKKNRKTYSTPSHPWQKARIDEEVQLSKEYGLKTKKEIWKMNSLLRHYARNAKKFATTTTKQQEIEKNQLLKKVQSIGLIKANSELGDILSLSIKDVLERRLQTLLHRKALARSMNQARQFITHGHVKVNGKKITSPSYLVTVDEENSIEFSASSALNNAEHPERATVQVEEK